jgi:hypothetical protein
MIDGSGVGKRVTILFMMGGGVGSIIRSTRRFGGETMQLFLAQFPFGNFGVSAFIVLFLKIYTLS